VSPASPSSVNTPGGLPFGSGPLGSGRFFSTPIRPHPAPHLAAWFERQRGLKSRSDGADEVAVAPSSLPSYEPRVIQQFAANLYRKASAVVVGSIVVGGAIGAAFGAVPLTPLGAAWPIPAAFGLATLIGGAFFGCVVGYVVGDTRSFKYRLRAQSALCQLQTERNTALIAAALAARSPVRPEPRPEVQQAAQLAGPPVTPPVSAAQVSAARVA
jgi:hypothetical protein